MKKLLMASAALATAFTAVPASAATFIFTGGGFAEGATIDLTFEATDVDMNGQISSFTGEVTDLTATFSGNSLVGPLAFTFDDLFGLVWDLDAVIGDGEVLDVEGLGLSNAFGEINVGPGPFALCDGVAVCSSVTDFVGDDGSIEGLTMGAAGGIPEPATWAFLIFGFGAIGGAMRRQRKANVTVSYA